MMTFIAVLFTLAAIAYRLLLARAERERDLYREALTKLCAAGFGYQPDREQE
jgi:hypothetical protein